MNLLPVVSIFPGTCIILPDQRPVFFTVFPIDLNLSVGTQHGKHKGKSLVNGDPFLPYKSRQIE